jgi:hypothetical protein
LVATNVAKIPMAAAIRAAVTTTKVILRLYARGLWREGASFHRTPGSNEGFPS